MMTDAVKSSKKGKITKEKVVKRSAADFFQDNKAIAGFDNTMRVVFTSVRELVENGLDAAERIGKLPELIITISRLKKEEIAKLLNVSSFDSSEKLDFIRLTVRDNGSGVQSEFVPPLFGRVLTGSNYGARQSRGRFGLGAKMVLLNAMSSVDLPLIVKSKHMNEDFTSYHEIMINLAENEPIILLKREIPQETPEAIPESGTEVSVTFTGSWNLASRWIREYFSQLSLITPYARILVTYPDSESPEEMPRVVEDMPGYPQIAKVHPWGTDITQFKREIAVTKSPTVEEFLQDHFQGIGKKTAQEFLEYVKIDNTKSPHDLSASDIRRIVHEGFVMPDSDPKKRRDQKYFPFKRPSGDSLSPLSAELLAKGIQKELDPQFVRSATGDISAYSGHPFIVEAALAYGGPILSKEEGSKSGTPRIYRYANRIPLLFGAGNDIITKCVQKMNWRNYKININKAPIAIVVSVVSSKIPFPETSKEYIADVDELRKEIYKVLKKLARGLGTHLGKAERERREKQRQSRFESAAPKVIDNLSKILETTDTPFLLKSPEEIAKLEKALASAETKLIRRKYPPSPAISSIGEWLPMTTYATLVENGIQTIYQFLRAPNVELMSITGLSEKRVAEIKRLTVTSQNRATQSPSLREFEIFDKRLENDFNKYLEAPRIHRALTKRWLVSALDLFATPITQLRMVESLAEKLIYESKIQMINTLIAESTIPEIEFDTLPWMTNDLQKSLKSAKIHTLFEYLASFPEKLADLPYLNEILIEKIKQEIREGIKQGYIDGEKVIGAATFEWMDYRVTPRLRGRKVSKIIEFLETSNEKLSELSELTENLINKSKDEIKPHLARFNDENSLNTLPGINETMKADFMRVEVIGFIDYLSKPNSELVFVRGLVDNLIIQKQDEIMDQVSQQHELFPIKHAWWLDRELENKLKSIGINSVFDFVRYPTQQLAEIKNLDYQTLETIKNTYGTPIPLINDQDKVKLDNQQIICLEELEFIDDFSKIKPEELSKKLKDLMIYIQAPICYLPIPSKFYQILHHLGVSQIFDFLIWPDHDLHHKGGLPYKLIEEIKSEISLDMIQDLIKSKSVLVSAISNNLDSKLLDKIPADFTLQELYYRLPYADDRLANLQLSKTEIETLIDIFLTPISRIPSIKPKFINKLRNISINTFIDLITWEREVIAKIIGRDEKYIQSIFENFEQFTSGKPLFNLGVFNQTEIKALISQGFKTVEDLYFRANHETFGTMGVKWKKIERYQRILETPVAMLQTRSEQGKISHDALERLADNGIDQIIKLVYWPENELQSILKIPEKRIIELKDSIAIKEHGMPLTKVCGYNKKTLNTLLSYGIETIEDLYFSASEDMVDEDDDIEWDYVKQAIEALDIPISFLDGIIATKYIEKLQGKKIDTIIRFLITSEEELSEILGTPIDNVENLRQKINLIRFRESTETSISILEGLTRKQLRVLSEENISSIYDFIIANDESLASILEMDLEQVSSMKNNLNYDSIRIIKEEKMVPLVKISLFDKRIVKQLARMGIESLADLYYVATPKTFEESSISWQMIQDARAILDLPIEIIPEITKKEINTLKKAKIKIIFDLLMESPEELFKRTNIDAETIESLQNSIIIDELITILKRLSVDKFNFPKEYFAEIKKNKLDSAYDLISYENEDLFLSQEGKKKVRIDKNSWVDVSSILSIPLRLFMNFENEIMKGLKRKRIINLRDAYAASEEKFDGLFEDGGLDFLETLRVLDFKEIRDFLRISICFTPHISPEWLFSLINNSIYTIEDILSCELRDLTKILNSSLPRTRNFIKEISMNSTLKCLEEELIPLDKLSSIFSSEIITKLESIGYNSLQDFIIRITDATDIDGVSDVLKILNSPVNRLSDDIPLSEIRKLSQQGISTIRDWLIVQNSVISDIIDIEKDIIYELKRSFDFKSISEVSDVETSLNDYIEKGYIDFDELNKLGIRTIEDLQFIEIDTLSASEEFLSRIRSLKDALTSSLAYYTRLPPEYVIPLALNGVTSVARLIRTEYSQIENPINITNEKYSAARETVNLIDIITHKKSDSEFRVRLSSLKAFTSKQLEQIQKLGYDNVIDLYFMLDTEQVPKSLVGSIESTKTVLEKPLALLPSVQEAFPQKIPLLHNAGITSIIEFLFWPKDELAELLEIKRYELSRYRKIDIGALRRKRNLGTPIENFPRIPEELIETFKQIGVDNIEDLYFLFTKYPNLIPDDVIPRKIITTCINDLESPVVKLHGLPIPVAQELVKKGITRIIDFLYWPMDDLKPVYGLSEAKIKKIKDSIRLREKSDVVGRLDSYMRQD
ncbi:MAG: DNA topoisomerase VI subunit B [Candidatus Heimdallarchaeota archaeon]|nr:DNA topoisomerase VI subunit B [Candidatus Heimdallarchaeota archaeon]